MLACASMAQTNMGQVQTPPPPSPPNCLWKSCLECSRCAPKGTNPGHWSAAAWLTLHQFAPEKCTQNVLQCAFGEVLQECSRSASGVAHEWPHMSTGTWHRQA